MFNWLLRLIRKNQPSDSLRSSVDVSHEASNLNKKPTIEAEALTSEDFSWVAFDENLLERARIQWQFGDWESLASISRESLQHHPERARLAVLVAAGHGQRGNREKLQQFIRLAQDWGCSPKLISQVLISGVENSLGLASLAAGQLDRAKSFFEHSVQTGMPGTDLKLLSGVRLRQQQEILGLKTRNGISTSGSPIKG